MKIQEPRSPFAPPGAATPLLRRLRRGRRRRHAEQRGEGASTETGPERESHGDPETDGLYNIIY